VVIKRNRDFVSAQATDGQGIRDFQYSTDRSINPMTTCLPISIRQ
jgi:hypothetical protein